MGRDRNQLKRAWTCRPQVILPLALMTLWLPAVPLRAAPHVPSDDAEVLQQVLPSADPRLTSIRALAAQLAQKPGDPDLSVALAAQQLSLGVAESDPRFVGYAQATLAPWWQLPDPPVPLRVLRARVLQAQHDFPAAKADLEAVLKLAPDHVDAHLVLAGVAETTGDFDTARRACDELGRIRPTLAATACAASVDSVTGHAQGAGALLAAAVARAHSRDPQLQCWAMTILAEIEDRQADKTAGADFQAALAESPNDVYTLTDYADFLLAQGRAGEVAKLLAGKTRIDALLLRLALAARDTGDAQLGPYVEELTGRYAAARARGEQLHLRDESRFLLELRGDPAGALALAKRNWTMLRTPVDARTYLAAALAAHDQDAIRTIRDWVAATKLEDRALQAMLDQAGPAKS
jgi:Tetratricopeptide repeat